MQLYMRRHIGMHMMYINIYTADGWLGFTLFSDMPRARSAHVCHASSRSGTCVANDTVWAHRNQLQRGGSLCPLLSSLLLILLLLLTRLAAVVG